MTITISKTSNFHDVENKLRNFIPTRKIFRSEKFLGKVNWGEDALEYQKRIRNEWD